MLVTCTPTLVHAAFPTQMPLCAAGLGFEPSAPAAIAMVLVPPLALVNYFLSRGKEAPVATESS